MLVVLDAAAGPRLRAVLDRHAHAALQIVDCDRVDAARFAALLSRADAVLHVLHPFSAGDFEAAPSLRLVQKLGVGVNTIDLTTARARGVSVCNLPGVNTPAVVEASLLGMLAALRQLRTYEAATRAGAGWTLPSSLGEGSAEIRGKTVGLIGLGDIASSLAAVLQALGATVLHHSRRTDRTGWRPLDQLLTESDIVSLHVPLDGTTAGMLSAERLAAMKPGAVLVNTARGGLVDRDGLIRALTIGPLRAAALDTFAVEPVDPSDALLALPNVVLTPHVAWLTMETLERCVDRAAGNLARLAAGDPLQHRVA
jgi:phosphoglycerate dehydrogenase-like enzyme